LTLQQRLQPRKARIAELENKVAGFEIQREELAETQKAMEDVVALLSEALQHTHIPGVSLVPEKAIAELREGGIDETILFQLINQLGWDQVGSLADVRRGNEQERTLSVEVSERLFKYSPLAQWAVWLWTGWGLGDKVTVTLDDEPAQEWWDEFVEAERNEPIISQDVIHELSDWLLVRGNRYIVFFVATSGPNAGKATARVLDQDEITPMANPDDKLESWFYKRTYHVGNNDETLFYPDFRTFLGNQADVRWRMLQDKKLIPANARRADEIQLNGGNVPGTVAIVFHIAHNRKDEKSTCGWPIFTAAAAWLRGHKQFAESRLGVAMAVAQFVRRSQVKGGSRAVNSVISQVASTLSRNNLLDTNPPGAAGSWHVENQASDTKELPMRTGASDAGDDNKLFSWMALLGIGLFPTSAGLDTSRWATAVEMDKAQSMIFERYQRFWAAQFQKMVRIVLMLGVKYGAQTFTETKAKISTDTFSLSDFPAVSESISKAVDSMLKPFVELGTIEEQTARMLLAELWRITLNALNVGSAGELTSPEQFGIGDENVPDETLPSDMAEVVRQVARRFVDEEITAEQVVEFLRAEE